MSGWGTGEPPCYVTNDHYWSGGICTSCGERLRCLCGRFIRVDDLDAHIDRGECRVVPPEPAADPQEAK